MDGIKLETDYLLNEFHDYTSAYLVGNESSSSDSQLQQRLALDEGIRDGFWLKARVALSEIPHKAIDDERMSLAIAKELIWNDKISLETLQFIDENISSEWATRQIGETILAKEGPNVQELRENLCTSVLCDSKYRQRLQEVLDMALQFENIVNIGKLGPPRKADVKSFVYGDIYLRILHDSQKIDSMTRLELLCTQVETANEFNSIEISRNLIALLDNCMKEDPLHTAALLQSNAKFARSIQDCIRWSPLGVHKSNSEFASSKFDFVAEYNKRRREGLPEVSSVLDLGCVMQVVTDPNALTLCTESLFSEKLYEQKQKFGLVPSYKLTFDDPIWSIDADHEGRYLVVGTLPGHVYTYERARTGFDLVEHVPVSQGAEQIVFHPKRSQFLVCRGGSAVGVVPDTHRWKVIKSSHSSSSYGDVCWHPTDEKYCFTVNDAEKKLHMCEFSSGSTLKTWELPHNPLAISVSGKDIVILTTKMTEKPQHILTVDFETSRTTDTQLPLFENDGMYTTLRCSAWDPRTILLIGPPNCIFLVDKVGQRPTRVIYGPKQKQCMLKATFAGPMDKYIIAASEEDREPQAIVTNRFTGERVATLVGHEKMVNDVAWSSLNSAAPPVLFTASDDRTVLVYEDTR